jgi:hypothetical protein
VSDDTELPVSSDLSKFQQATTSSEPHSLTSLPVVVSEIRRDSFASRLVYMTPGSVNSGLGRLW